MIILKGQEIRTGASDLAMFININGIKKEDIFSVTAVHVTQTEISSTITYTIFYYADSDKQPITKGVFGW